MLKGYKKIEETGRVKDIWLKREKGKPFRSIPEGLFREDFGLVGDVHSGPGKAQVILFSREGTLREAIQYHQPVLEHCWLLVTPEMQDRAKQAMGHFPDLRFTLHALGDRYDSQACYQTVCGIYQREASRLDVPPEQVIADITGGTKPMTMGMIVACLDGGYPIEHVPTAFDADGHPTGPLPPIQIVVQRGANGGEE